MLYEHVGLKILLQIIHAPRVATPEHWYSDGRGWILSWGLRVKVFKDSHTYTISEWKHFLRRAVIHCKATHKSQHLHGKGWEGNVQKLGCFYWMHFRMINYRNRMLFESFPYSVQVKNVLEKLSYTEMYTNFVQIKLNNNSFTFTKIVMCCSYSQLLHICGKLWESLWTII